MKTIILGDTHGRTIWKDIVNQEHGFDKLVFIGDYFDSREGINAEEQCNNFLDICAFKKKSPDTVILLVGNHDYHYFDFVDGQRYSGYQYASAPQIKYLLEQNKDALQMCYEQPDFICTHAGVSKTWLSNQRFAHGSIGDRINDLWRYTPSVFKFMGSDPYGDSFVSSPIWIRPNSLAQNGINKLQIVGHTMVEKINHPKGDRAKFYLIDALGTSKEYLVIEDDEIKIRQLQ